MGPGLWLNDCFLKPISHLQSEPYELLVIIGNRADSAEYLFKKEVGTMSREPVEGCFWYTVSSTYNSIKIGRLTVEPACGPLSKIDGGNLLCL